VAKLADAMGAAGYERVRYRGRAMAAGEAVDYALAAA
jgi:hypothetical protein